MQKLISLAVLALAGCWQTTLYVGPRIAGDGVVAWELGASLGASAPVATGALSTSVDSSQLITARPERTVARKAREQGNPETPRGMVRGVVEWSEWTPGFSWRAGLFAGAAFDDHQRATGVLGCQAMVSPLVWGRSNAIDDQHIAIGVQVGSEAIPGWQQFAVRAALAIDLQYLPKRW